MFNLFPPHEVDSYKTGHFAMINPETDLIYSNFTPRSDRLFKGLEGFYDGKVTVFGIQGAIDDMVERWQTEFFSKPKEEVLFRIKNRMAAFSGGMTVDVSHWADLHDYGRLPVVIRSIDEGKKVRPGVPVLTIHNCKTTRRFAWLVNYLETALSNELWHPMTVATIASVYRNLLDHYAEKTGTPAEFVDWQAHDFSCRGMSSMYGAAKACAGHLVYFLGTDTISAVDYINWGYTHGSTFIGGSVPASEHMVMTLEGEQGEADLIKRLITKVVPTGVVSLVCDGFDYWGVLTKTIPSLKDEILARQQDANGFAKVVVRPDSGDPVRIICGYEDDEWFTSPGGMYVPEEGRYITEEERKGSVEVLWEIFGGTMTETGHKMLDSHIGLIYGDSITLERAEEILRRLEKNGFASGNVVFGIGSYTYQYNTRDTFGFAMKCTYAVVDGIGRDIYKAPKTDSGVKKSARGLLRVDEVDGELVLGKLDEYDFRDDDHGELKVRFFDGAPIGYQSIDEIRRLARS